MHRLLSLSLQAWKQRGRRDTVGAKVKRDLWGSRAAKRGGWTNIVPTSAFHNFVARMPHSLHVRFRSNSFMCFHGRCGARQRRGQPMMQLPQGGNTSLHPPKGDRHSALVFMFGDIDAINRALL